jgi:3-phytase
VLIIQSQTAWFMMKSFIVCLLWAPVLYTLAAAQIANITLVPAAVGFEGDNTGFIYGRSPLLAVNDGSAVDGGFRIFAITNSTSLKETSHPKTGRSKIVVPVHNIGGRDLIVNIPAPDSLIRVFDAQTGKKVDSNDKRLLGDWSTACVWHSHKSGESYVYVFGKKKVVQLLVRNKKKDAEILEVWCPLNEESKR